MSPNSRSRFCRSDSDIVTAFFSRFSCIFFSCSANLESSCPRWENSCSSFFWARWAAGASRRIRSRLTNPMLDWARAGPTVTTAARHGKQQLRGYVDLAVAAEEAAVYVARAQGRSPESAYAADAARVVVLEKRQGPPTIPVTSVELPTEHEGEAARVRIEILVGIGILPVLQVSGGRSQLQTGTLEVTLRRPDEAVSQVADPARGAGQPAIGTAELVLKIEVTLRAVASEEKFDPLRTEAEEQSVVLGKRHAEPYPPADRAGPVIADSQRGGRHIAPVYVKATADSLHRAGGVGKGKRGDLIDGSGCDLHAHGVTGAEKIALLNRGLNDELVDIGKTHTEQHRAGGLLLDPHGDVDLVGRAGHRRSLDLDFAEIARLVDSLLGELQLLAVEKAALELAHLASHHLVAGARIADDVDPPDIDAPPGIDQKREADLALFLVDI